MESPKWNDFLDGKLEPASPYTPGKYGQWVMGSNIAPGWVGLAAFNLSQQYILEKSDTCTETNKQWTFPLPFYGELAKNKLVKECQYTNSAKEISDGLDNDCDGFIDEEF